MHNAALTAIMRQLIKRTSGNVAILFSIVSPVLILSSLAAVDYTSLARRHTSLQAAVDSAALAGARELNRVQFESRGF
jgi:Flp pilus assembly protein TadG